MLLHRSRGIHRTPSAPPDLGVPPRPEPITATLVRTRGPRCWIREGTEADWPLLDRLWGELSPRTRALRWLAPVRPEVVSRLWRQSQELCAGRGVPQRVWVAALASDPAELVAVAQLAPLWDQPGEAEVGLVVRDDLQRCGIGRVLAHALVQDAQRRGFTRVHAVVLAENQPALRLLEGLGLPYTLQVRSGEAEVQITVPQSEAGLAMRVLE